MSIHDTMALWAFSEERMSVEFHSLAQKHANATWIFIVVAGIVWFFANWI